MALKFEKKSPTLHVAFLALTIASFGATRAQALIDDRQFIASMIPHHSGAILMCQQASLTDPEVLGLCEEIVSSQEREIAQMKAILARR